MAKDVKKEEAQTPPEEASTSEEEREESVTETSDEKTVPLTELQIERKRRRLAEQKLRELETVDDLKESSVELNSSPQVDGEELFWDTRWKSQLAVKLGTDKGFKKRVGELEKVIKENPTLLKQPNGFELADEIAKGRYYEKLAKEPELTEDVKKAKTEEVQSASKGGEDDVITPDNIGKVISRHQGDSKWFQDHEEELMRIQKGLSRQI